MRNRALSDDDRDEDPKPRRSTGRTASSHRREPALQSTTPGGRSSAMRACDDPSTGPLRGHPPQGALHSGQNMRGPVVILVRSRRTRAGRRRRTCSQRRQREIVPCTEREALPVVSCHLAGGRSSWRDLDMGSARAHRRSSGGWGTCHVTQNALVAHYPKRQPRSVQN